MYNDEPEVIIEDCKRVEQLLTDIVEQCHCTLPHAVEVLRLRTAMHHGDAARRATAAYAGQRNRDTLLPDPSGMRVHPSLARTDRGAMTSAQVALVHEARRMLRDQLTRDIEVGYLESIESLLSQALGDEGG